MKGLNAEACIIALMTGTNMGLFSLAVDTLVKLIDNFSYNGAGFDSVCLLLFQRLKIFLC